MVADRESDASLVRRFRSGDDAAFDVLYERYRKSVYTSCYAVLVEEEPATDVASATFAMARADPRLYRKVAGHIDRCAACGQTRQQKFVPAEWLPVVIPLLVVPYELRQRIMEEAQDLAVRVAGTSQPSVTAMSSSSALAFPAWARRTTGPR